MQLCPWAVGTNFMKIGGFQICKKHSPSLKAFRITTCQIWCISLVFFKNLIFLLYCIFSYEKSGIYKHCWFFTFCELHQLWQAVILNPFKLEECILHCWKPPIFIDLVPAGQAYSWVLNTWKSVLNMDLFETLYLVAPSGVYLYLAQCTYLKTWHDSRLTQKIESFIAVKDWTIDFYDLQQCVKYLNLPAGALNSHNQKWSWSFVPKQRIEYIFHFDSL